MNYHGAVGAGESGPFSIRRHLSLVEEAADLPLREDVPSGGWRVEEIEAQERAERWEEVDLFLEMWLNVARSWGNETLLRHARLEAEKVLLERSAPADRAETREQER